MDTRNEEKMPEPIYVVSVINVSNKPVETSANEILNMMANRFEYRGHRLESPYPEMED